jgi:hypothetical protein
MGILTKSTSSSSSRASPLVLMRTCTLNTCNPSPNYFLWFVLYSFPFFPLPYFYFIFNNNNKQVDTVTKGRIFSSLVGLLKHWMSIDWATAIDPERYSSSPLLLLSSSHPQATPVRILQLLILNSKFGIFAPKPAKNVDHYRTIYELIKCVPFLILFLFFFSPFIHDAK